MPLEVGLVGLPGAGKTTLFTALDRVPRGAYGKEHVGIAPIPDERLEPIAAVESSDKTTPATVKVVDPPGLSAPVLGELRKADALVAVLRSFGPEADPEHDLESIQLELSSPTATTSRSASSAYARRRSPATRGCATRLSSWSGSSHMSRRARRSAPTPEISHPSSSRSRRSRSSR